MTPSNQLEGHEFTVWSLAITPNGQTIISGGQDATIRLWDFASGKELNKFVGHDGPVYSIAMMQDGKHLVSIADKDLAVKIWDIESLELISSLAPNSAHVTAVAVSPESFTILMYSSSNVDASRQFNTIDSR